MKRFLSVLLALCLPFSMLACGAAEQTAKEAPTTTAPTEETVPETTPWPTSKEAYQGKKILVLGNSYSFCGYTVIGGDCKVLTQEKRENDQGILYQLFKANGVDVSITNWAFGSHSLNDFFSGDCQAGRECDGVDHAMHLTDPYFDYVVLQIHVERNYTRDLAKYLSVATDFFRAANPDVKFVLHVPHMAHHHNNAWVRDLDELAAAGIKVADWGGMIHDILNGNAEVPGATQEYKFNTFVISWREDDGFHQNLLCGYLTALMIYCAFTNESAVGQPWEFTNDPSLHPKMDWEASKALHYSYNPETNFIEVFKSEADMLGLQQLADQYLAKYNSEVK